MTTPLFDVIISVSGDDDGGGVYDVTIIDKYHHDTTTRLIGHKIGMHSLDEAMQFAKGAVTAFMEGTQV